MEKQIYEEEEMILDKAEFQKQQMNNKNEKQQKIEKNEDTQLIIEEQNIEDNQEDLKLADMIDWTRLSIIEQHEQYTIEEAPIKNQLKKLLTILRIKKSNKYQNSALLFEETKNNYLLIKENFQKFHNMAIIFDIKEVGGKELIVVVQHYQNQFNLKLKYSSLEYMKWQQDNAKDLLQLYQLGVTFNSGPLHKTSFVQTRMNNFIINPKIFISLHQPEENGCLEINKGEITQEQIEEKDYKTKQGQSKLKCTNNEIISNLIIKGILSCLSNILQRNIFEIDLVSKKNSNIERLILSLIEEIVAKEKELYVNLVMEDFQKGQRWHLLELKKKKKGRRFSSSLSKKKNSKNQEDINSELQEEWEELKQQTQQQALDNFQSQNQQLFDLIISIYETRSDLQATHNILKEYYLKEKNLKKKCIISLSDERNIKKLVQLLQKSTNKQSQKQQKAEEAQKDKENTTSKSNKKLDQNQKVRKQIKKQNNKTQTLIPQKRIQIIDHKRKQTIPKKTGRLYINSSVKEKNGIIAKQKNGESIEEDELKKYNIHTVKFAFSIYGETKEVSQLYKTLRTYKNNFISITLLFSAVKLNSNLLKKYIIPILSFPNLLYMILHLNGCFQSNPIFYELEDLEEVTQKDIEEDNSGSGANQKKGKRKIQNENNNDNGMDNIVDKSVKIQDIINDLIEKGQNPNLEFFEIHLEKNYARDEDIDILFGFLKGAFKNIIRLEIGWQDAFISESQLTQICHHLSYFKDQLNQIGLTLWKNAKIGDDQVKEICDCLSQFTRLGLITLGLLECKITDEVGKILRDLLQSLPFLLVLEIGLDDNYLNTALGYIGEGLKTQKLLKYLGISFQESYLSDESLVKFSSGLREMYNLEDFHFFVGKNSLTSESTEIFFKALHPYSRQLQILDLGFQKNNLSDLEFLDQFCEFIKQQFNLIKIELCFDNTKLKGEGIARILESINRDQQLEVLHLNLQSCSLNMCGFVALSNLLHEIIHPEILTNLRIYVPHNVMNLNEVQQQHLGTAIGRFTNLIELDLDLSGCHLFNEFFLSLSTSLQSLYNLESYTLILHKCFLSQLRMKCILEGLQNKKILKDLSLEFQDTEIPLIDQIYDHNELLTTVEIYLPELKQVSLNFLRCGWSFKLVILILVQIGSTKNKSKALPNFNSLNVYVCNQQMEEKMVHHFRSIVNSLYSNAAELTLTFDDCDIDDEICSSLFDFSLTQLRNIDLSLSENIELNLRAISQFISNQTNLQFLGLKLKHVVHQIAEFGYLGGAIKNCNLKMFNLYFEQSQLTQPRQLEYFYEGLSTQDNIECITLHLHNIDHSTNQIKQFAQRLQYMNKLVSLNLHLPNSMLRKEEINQISVSIGNKPYLKELILEFYKNEIIYKNGMYFARSLSTLPNLQKLDFSLMRCEILPSTAEKLCLSIGELKQLRKMHLYLGENQINSFTLVFLAYSLYNLQNIRNFKINLQDTQIGDEGLVSLSQGLLNLKKIIILDLNLENTDIEQESLLLLGRFFRENSENLYQLELNLRNNSSITEIGFRGLMDGIGQAKCVTQMVIMFNHCHMNAVTSSHLPLLLQNKKNLKFLQIYFDENQLEGQSAKVLGTTLMNSCPKVKRFTLCVQLNQLGNNGVNDLFDGIFQMPELQKATIDIRQNEINNKNTLVKMGASITKCNKLKDLELLIFENQEANDKQIAKGLYALAQAELNLYEQLVSFDVRNQYWKDSIKNSIIPITTRMLCHMQIVAFHNYLSPILHYNDKFTIWDLYLP